MCESTISNVFWSTSYILNPLLSPVRGVREGPTQVVVIAVEAFWTIY